MISKSWTNSCESRHYIEQGLEIRNVCGGLKMRDRVFDSYYERTCTSCNQRITVGDKITGNKKTGYRHFFEFQCESEIYELPEHSIDLWGFYRLLGSSEFRNKLNLYSIKGRLNLEIILKNEYRLCVNLLVINNLFPNLEIFTPEQMINSDGTLRLPNVHHALKDMYGDWVNERLALLAILHDGFENARHTPIPIWMKNKFRLGSDQNFFIDVRQFPEYVAICALTKNHLSGDGKCLNLVQSCRRVAKSSLIKMMASNLLENIDMHWLGDKQIFLDVVAMDIDGSVISNREFATDVVTRRFL